MRTREFEDGAVVDSRYRVLSLLGAGGMGSVYEVEHTQLDKRFVLKALHREYTDRQDLVQRLKIERLSLAKLEHPNIVRVTDAGTSAGGVAFFVMEKLEGETLSALLHRRGALSVAEALGISRDILDALAAAHQVGVIHRDVKPANVFITRAGTVKLLDFGIAKVASNKSITLHGATIGTPRYMPPEQARGDQIDSRADIYAAGLLLYEMLAGQGPFHAIREPVNLIQAQLFTVPPPLSEVVDSVDRELDELCVAMLAKEPDQRPASAAELVKQLGGMRRRIQNQSEPLPGSNQTTVPGALAHTSADLPAARRRPLSLRPRAAGPSAAVFDNRTEPLPRTRGVDTRTSLRPSGGDSLATHTNSAAAEIPMRRSSSRVLWHVVGVAVACGAAILAWRTLAPEADRTSEVSAAGAVSAPALSSARAPERAPIVVEPAQAPKVEKIKLTIESTPVGASVYRQPSNVLVGTTPHELVLDPAEGHVVFTLAKAGYRTEEVVMGADQDGRRDVSLTPVPKPKSTRTPTRTPTPKLKRAPAPEPESAPESVSEPKLTPKPTQPVKPGFDPSSDDRTIDPWQ